MRSLAEAKRGQSEDMRNVVTPIYLRSSCSIICIKCRRRREACICRAGKPDDRRNGQHDNIRHVQQPHLFLAPSPGRKEASHRQRISAGRVHGSSCGNDRKIRPFKVVAPIRSFNRAHYAVISDYCAHLVHDTRRARGVGGVGRLFRFQCHPITHALSNADRPSRFPVSAQVHSLYGRHRLYFRINSPIWPDSQPRAPDGPRERRGVPRDARLPTNLPECPQRIQFK